MLHLPTIAEPTLVLLKQLQGMDLLSGLRLVGGTSLALQLGHRLSIDLDLFGTITAGHEEILEELIANGLNVVSEMNSKTIHIFNINNVKVDIVNYRYGWFEQPIQTDGIRLAGLKDIAAMKLEAITNRGSRKDFIDVYFLLQHFSLPEMLDLYLQKYTSGSIYNVIRSLAYFTDAEAELMPEMLIPVQWYDVKATIREAIEAFDGENN